MEKELKKFDFEIQRSRVLLDQLKEIIGRLGNTLKEMEDIKNETIRVNK